MVKSGKNAQKRHKVSKTACWFLCIGDLFYFVCMAKQAGILKIKGTINGICFYCLDGEFYARAKSSLSGERVKTDPAFAETMRYAQRMGSASTIASEIYKLIVPQHERSRDRFREMVRMVRREMDATLRLHEF
jgi:hypothetical protein